MKITKTLDVTQGDDGWIIASTPTPDRDRDRVMPLGGDFRNFEKNPVLIFGHNYHEPWAVIGRVAEMAVDHSGIRMRPELRQPANEADPMHIIRALWDQKLLRASSIGFIPIESRENELGGHDFLKWELLELSLTPLPANQEAIRLAVKALSDTSEEAHNETDMADPDDVATPAALDELTPDQANALAQTLIAVMDELTDYLHGD